MQVCRRTAQAEPLNTVSEPLLRRVFAHRGVADANDIALDMQGLLPPDTMPGIQLAAERLAIAVTCRQRILIVGDFDADGATSVALCLLTLREFGAPHVDFLVPNRFEYGYGLSPEIVDLASQSSPDLIVTVDNGVSSVAGVARARELGVDVIVTDHHLPGRELPDAYALVNPNLRDSTFGSPAMAGVGVAYYLLAVLRRVLLEQGWFDSGSAPNLAQYLDLVALGTVADVVPLDANNRRLVHQGLRRIRGLACRPGIRALAEVAKRDLRTCSAQDLGFALGPRLNAAGRLDDISLGIKCLLEDDLNAARRLASALDQLNQSRRHIEQEMVNDAQLLVAQSAADANRVGMCVYHESFHQGVVGIVAGRLREQFHKPVVAFADAGDLAPGELKGSARSVEGLHIRDVFDRIASSHPGLLLKFGGHAMAAGLSIKRVHFNRFATVFDKTVQQVADPEILQAKIFSDGELAANELSITTAQLLAAAGPWGAAFPEPAFDGTFDLVSQRVVGQQHLKLVLKHDSKVIDAIAFRTPQLPSATRRVEAVYKIGVNDFGQVPTAQLIVEYLRPIA